MHCCNGGEPAATAISTRSVVRIWAGRGGALMQWALPITALTLAPKCPACFAGYVLLFTGVGLSIPAAETTQWVLIFSCMAALLILTGRLLKGLMKTGR
ncbi:MAG: hypothetical protein ACREJD_01050 [Phycisphaerales bacterium]